MNKIYNVNGKQVQAKSNKWAIVNLYPCLQFAVLNGSISLTKAVKLANCTFGTHYSRSQQAYITSQQVFNNHIMSIGI